MNEFHSLEVNELLNTKLKFRGETVALKPFTVTNRPLQVLTLSLFVNIVYIG